MSGMSVRDLAAAFARGERSNTRSYGALTIKDATLYSYAMPIAKWLDNGNLWITTEKRSVTTSKHTNFVRRFAYDNSWVRGRIVESESPNYCPNCNMHISEHVDGKCLFDHTRIET